jgi:hypothetical protein
VWKALYDFELDEGDTNTNTAQYVSRLVQHLDQSTSGYDGGTQSMEQLR